MIKNELKIYPVAKSSKKVFKLMRKFARSFGYDYKKIKSTFAGLDEETKKEYLEKMQIFIMDMDAKKIKARELILLPVKDPVMQGNLL